MSTEQPAAVAIGTILLAEIAFEDFGHSVRQVAGSDQHIYRQLIRFHFLGKIIAFCKQLLLDREEAESKLGVLAAGG